MDNKFIEIRLLNVGDCGVGLRDTQGRFYNIPMNSQLRISLDSIKNILDNPVKKKIICKLYLKM